MKENVKKCIVCIIALLCAVFAWMCTSKISFAKTLEEHKAYSKQECNHRIRVIRDYYYKKSNKLTTVNRKWTWNFEEGNITFYFHGQDLMFGYGKSKKGNEYRLYFYNDQLIRLLVDEKGKKQKTYEQKYIVEDNSDDFMNTALYMELESYGRKESALKRTAVSKILADELVKITKVEGNVIYYHKLYCTGPDGYIQWISKQLYKATMNKNVKIMSVGYGSDDSIKRSTAWLKKVVNTGNFVGYGAELKKSGNTVSKIQEIYFA